MIRKQNCWNEVEKKGGVSLAQQEKDYKRWFTPWPAPTSEKKKPDVVGENLQYLIKVLEATKMSLSSVKSVLGLQERLIVLNANEFKLRDNPTDAEFEDILADFEKWHLRPKECWVGDDKTKQEALAKLACVVKEARIKFQELSSNQNGRSGGAHKPTTTFFI